MPAGVFQYRYWFDFRIQGLSSPDKRAGRQRHAILQATYREAEHRGADPWQEADFSELETVLKVHGGLAGGRERGAEGQGRYCTW